jgi:hypothetical protein
VKPTQSARCSGPTILPASHVHFGPGSHTEAKSFHTGECGILRKHTAEANHRPGP